MYFPYNKLYLDILHRLYQEELMAELFMMISKMQFLKGLVQKQKTRAKQT